jgi:hypothetical protein
MPGFYRAPPAFAGPAGAGTGSPSLYGDGTAVLLGFSGKNLFKKAKYSDALQKIKKCRHSKRNVEKSLTVS